MLPLRDNLPTRRFPVVTVALIAANIVVFVLYQGAGEGESFFSSVNDFAFRPCEVEESCPTAGEGWLVTLFSSMFLHAGWLHLLGNMLYLWIFGNNVEDTLGRPRYIAFYVLGGVAAMATQSAVTLLFGTQADASIPNLGASGPSPRCSARTSSSTGAGACSRTSSRSSSSRSPPSSSWASTS